MSEQLPTTTGNPLGFAKMEETIRRSDGARLYYGIDEDGKKRPRSSDKILGAYGYADYKEPPIVKPLEGKDEPPIDEPEEIEEPPIDEEEKEEPPVDPPEFEDGEWPSIPKETPSRPNIGRRHGVSGIRSMEDDAALKLAKRKKEKDIEVRRNSHDVALLNDRAGLEVYGSKGRTYTDPETGEVIASKDNPIIGRIQEIRENRRYGTTEKERNDAADQYEQGINDLLGDDFELTQAKMIMDMRETDLMSMNRMVGEFMNDGMSATAAGERAAAVYAKKDAKRLEIIKENGLMSAEEYSVYIGSGNGSDSQVGNNGMNEFGGVGDEPYGPEGPREPTEAELRRAELTENLAYHRDEYARLTARSRNSYMGRFADENSGSRLGRLMKRIPGVQRVIDGLNDRTDVATREARERYNEAASMLADDIAVQLRGLETELTDEQRNHISYNGQLWQDALLEQSIVEYSHEESRQGNRFTDWWVRNSGLKGSLKKFAVVAGAGVVTGLTAGLAAPLLAGGLTATIAAPTVVGGVTGGSIGVHVNRRRANSFIGEHEGKQETVAERNSREDRKVREEAMRDVLDSGNEQDIGSITSGVESETRRRMQENRRTVRRATAAGKLGGAASTFFDLANLEARNPLSDQPEDLSDASDPPARVHHPINPEPHGGPNGPTIENPNLPDTTGPRFNPEGDGVGEHRIPNPDAGSGVDNTPEAPVFDNLDNSYPWDHMTKKLGKNGTPRILKLNSIAEDYGYKIIGHGGGGNGVIDSVVMPDGTVFTDNGHINAVLDFLDKQSK